MSKWIPPKPNNLEQTQFPQTQQDLGINRAKLTSATAAAWFFAHTCVIVLRGITLGFDKVHIITPYSLAITLFVWFGIRKKWKITPLAIVLLVNISIALTFFSFHSHGFSGPVIYVFIVIPIMGFLLINRLAGWLACALVIGIFTIFAYLNFNDYAFNPAPIRGNGIFIARAISATLVVTLLCWISWYYTHLHDNFIESIEKANRNLSRTAKYKSDFLSNMSHELRTPLNAIIGYSARLLRKEDKSIDRRRWDSLEAINRSGNELLQLINDILDMSKIESGQLKIHTEQQEIFSPLQKIVLKLQPLAHEKRLSLDIINHCPSADIYAQVDIKRFSQMIHGLIRNAIKYTHKGSIIVSISATNDQPLEHDRARHENTVGNTANWIKISVSDTGIGIDEADREHLFDKFSRASQHQRSDISGTGLGLVILNELMHMHGGLIEIESEPNHGSCFSIYFRCS